jgi:hypothetical protein
MMVVETENEAIIVDVFPYDNVPDSVLKRKIQGKKYFICKRILWMKKGMGENNHNGDQFCKNKQSVYGLYADTGICGKLDDRQMIPCIGIQKQAVSTCADSNKDFSAYAVETDCKI